MKNRLSYDLNLHLRLFCRFWLHLAIAQLCIFYTKKKTESKGFFKKQSIKPAKVRTTTVFKVVDSLVKVDFVSISKNLFLRRTIKITYHVRHCNKSEENYC